MNEDNTELSGTPQLTEQDIIECLDELTTALNGAIFKGKLEPVHGIVDMLTAHMQFAELFINHFEGVDPEKYKQLIDQLYAYYDKMEAIRTEAASHMQDLHY